MLGLFHRSVCDRIGHNYEIKYCQFGNEFDLLVFKRCITCNEKFAYLATIHDIENINTDWAEKYFLNPPENKIINTYNTKESIPPIY
jgi:hypothetical protein